MDYKNNLNKVLQRLKDIDLVLNESSIVVFTDQRGTIEYANDKFCELSQYTKEELIGQNQSIVNSGYHSKTFFKNMWRTIGTGNVWNGEIKNRKKDGSYYWVDTTIVPFLDAKNKPYQYAAIRHDITKLKEQEQILKEKAYYDDPITSLKNRHWLKEWIHNQQSSSQKHYTVMFLDVDQFKSINDTFGHYAGDIVLMDIAKRITNCLYAEDFVIRQGGDEFIIFLNHVGNDKNKVVDIVHDMKEEFSLPFYIDGKQLYITISIGVSMNTVNKEKDNDLNVIETTMKEADTAAAHAKKHYGNSYKFNTTEQNEEIKRYYELISELTQALDNNEFRIVYQPFINIKTGAMEGVEALLRWENPRLGKISPIEFIPLLEESGMIIPLGNWIIKTVCQQMKRWQTNGICIKRAAINVSPIQFGDDNFVSDVKRLITENNLAPDHIELEITESILMNIVKAEGMIKDLRQFGVSISIDDFGTGYSSLSYLTRLPISTLKIDKSFIDSLNTEGDVIVNTIITMGKNLGFKVLAEGIEEKAQIAYLQSENCHEGQGYYWSKPISPEEIESFYNKQLQ